MSTAPSIAGRSAGPGGRPPRTPPLATLGIFVVWGPAVLLGDPQASQRGRRRGVPGSGLVVRVAGQDHRGLAPFDQAAGTPSWRDVRARPQAIDQVLG